MSAPGFRRLRARSAAVIFGVMGQAVGRGWLAKDLTGSNAGLGGVMLAFGVLDARWRRRSAGSPPTASPSAPCSWSPWRC